MKKKILFGAVSLAAVVSGVAGLSAFEAHVINVTAKIENALNVSTYELKFGTVFPQEKFDKTFEVSLSQSFQDEDRVDDIEYVLRQKPKCADNPDNPQEFSQATENEQGNFICETTGHEILPLLCPYLSKSEITDDPTEGQENDGEDILAFHGPITGWTMQDTFDHQTFGKLIKSGNDFSDTWNIDLKVPCFGGNCAQDWESFVLGINASATPSAYVQPIEDESKTYGCDLWLEVFNISLPGFGCEEELDLMLVLDRSGSIEDDGADEPDELDQLKSAASAFVEALMPAASGNDVHVGQSSFATTGSLDQHLTDVKADVLAKIAALSSSGFTNLAEGISLATDELADAHEHERAIVADVMVIITDGNPNRPTDETTARTAASDAADAARAADVEVFVVGVGGDVDATYLTNEIADPAPPAHYFDAANFEELEDVLVSLTACPNGE